MLAICRVVMFSGAVIGGDIVREGGGDGWLAIVIGGRGGSSGSSSSSSGRSGIDNGLPPIMVAPKLGAGAKPTSSTTPLFPPLPLLALFVFPVRVDSSKLKLPKAPDGIDGSPAP